MTNRLREAARQALGWIDKWWATGSLNGVSDLRDQLRAALAEPAPEPVAWMYRHESEPPGDGRVTTLRWGFVTREWIETPLYTHPPRREWHGLTDEELAELARQEQLLLICDDFDALREIARAIEANLKERNK